MANTKKRIKFHPLDLNTGEIIKNEDLYPETSLENVVDVNTGKKLDTIIDEIKEEIATRGDVPSTRKVAGISLAQDTYDVKEYRYEDSVKTIDVAATEDDLVNGNTYSVRSSYDWTEFDSIFNLISESATVYGDASSSEPTGDTIEFYKDGDEKYIYLYLYSDGIRYDYDTENETWGYWEEVESDDRQFVPCETLPQVTIDKSKIITGAPINLGDLVAQIFIAPHQETIETHQSLQEKIEDLPNWEYEKKPITKIIPGLETGAEYKINFNPVNNYTEYLTPSLNSEIYDDNDNSLYISGTERTYYGLRIGTYNGDDNYYLQFDLSDPTKLVVWRKGAIQSDEEWSQADLDNITVKWYANGVNQSRDPQLMDDLLKAVFKNTDGSTITSFVEGTTYKFNTNAIEYRNIFDTLYENFYYGSSSTIYSYPAPDSYLAYLEVYRYHYPNTPCINYHNNNNFFLVPSISETYYPGRWSKQGNPWSDPSNSYYTAQELLEVPTFIFNRNCIQSQPKSEEFLHKFLLNADGTAIKEDEEIITGYETKSLKENLDNYKDWKYEDGGQGLFDIPEWYKLSDIPQLVLSTIYASPDIQIIVSNSAGIIEVEISPSQMPTESFNYFIFNKDVSEGGLNAKANTWYSADQQTSALIEIKTPEITCLEQYIVDYAHFEAIYGDKVITLGQKIDKLVAEQGAYLKDQIYDKVIKEVSMESAQTDPDIQFALKDNYDYETVMSIFDGVINTENTNLFNNFIWVGNNKCIIPALNYSQELLCGAFYYMDFSSNSLAMADLGTLISSFRVGYFGLGFETGRWLNDRGTGSTYITQENLPRFTFEELNNGDFMPFPLALYAVTEYDLLDSEPEDWSNYYFDYYYHDNETDKYYHIPQGEGAPTFEQDAYYRRVNSNSAGNNSAPTFEQNKYAEVYYNQLDEEPDDWETNWMKYFAYYEGQYIPIIVAIIINDNSSDGLPTLPPDFDELSEAVGVYELDYDILNDEPANWHIDWPDYYDIAISENVLDNIIFVFKEVEQKLSETPLADKLYTSVTNNYSGTYLKSRPSNFPTNNISTWTGVTIYRDPTNSISITYYRGPSSASYASANYYTFYLGDDSYQVTRSIGISWPNNLLSIPLDEKYVQDATYFDYIAEFKSWSETKDITVEEKVADIKNWEYEKIGLQTKTVESQVNSLYYRLVTEDIPAPTAPNTTGRLIMVLYNDEDLVETKYDGYLYFFVDGDLSVYEAMLAG